MKTNNFTAFHAFWEDTVNIASYSATPTNSHGYGMVAAKDNSSALRNAVSNFRAAYAATQGSQSTRNKAINAMQGQM
jgi:hypothetical protein